jgi:hypothetical protein
MDAPHRWPRVIFGSHERATCDLSRNAEREYFQRVAAFYFLASGLQEQMLLASGLQGVDAFQASPVGDPDDLNEQLETQALFLY